MERMQSNWTGCGPSEKSLKIMADHQLNQQPDERKGAGMMVWPQEEKTGKADESNLQKLLQKREGMISSPHARWRRGEEAA